MVASPVCPAVKVYRTLEDDAEPCGRRQFAVCVEPGAIVPTPPGLTLAVILALGMVRGLPVARALPVERDTCRRRDTVKTWVWPGHSVTSPLGETLRL
jgi:hypothetical protein